MSNILFLDIYKQSPFRQSKDTNGGYGTVNDLGSGVFPEILSRLAKLATFWPQLSCLNLISELISVGHSVKYERDIKKVNDSVDVIFIPASIINCKHEINAIETISTAFPKIRIFSFGSVLHHFAENYRNAGSAVIVGEAEFLGQKMQLNQSNLESLHNESLITVESGNPDDLSLPRWSEIHFPLMRNFIFNKSFSSTAPIIATRGCPYSCFEYCTYPLAQGRKVRSTNPDKLIDDINYIYKNTGTTNFVFRDPVFSINRGYSEALLLSLANLPKRFSFSVETHLNNVTEDLVTLFKDANVTTVKFGIESSSQEVMDSVSRYSIAHETEKERISFMKKEGIKTHAMYILCQPDDDEQSIKRTIAYSTELNTSLAQYSLFTPYPGTPYYEKNKHLITSEDYEMFTQFNLVYKHKHFTPVDARRFLGDAYRSFYLPKFLH